MADIYMKKKGDGSFVPVDQQSLDRARKLKIGDVYRHEVKKPRNYKFHAKYFSLITLAFDNQEKYTCIEAFRDAVTIDSGWYTTSYTFDGRPIIKAKSISFAKMEDIEFNELYEKTITTILQNVLQCDRDDLLEMVLNYA